MDIHDLKHLDRRALVQIQDAITRELVSRSTRTEEIYERAMAERREEKYTHRPYGLTESGLGPVAERGSDYRAQHADKAAPDSSMHLFKTGAKRSELKPRYDLIPFSFMYRLAQRFTGRSKTDGGALKYGEGNWERGLPTSDLISHLEEHVLRLADAFRKSLTKVTRDEGPWHKRMERVRQDLRGHLDADDDLGAAAWGLAALAEQLETGFYHDTRFEHEDRGATNPGPRRNPDSSDHLLKRELGSQPSHGSARRGDERRTSGCE
jgi:hypothetical protein